MRACFLGLWFFEGDGMGMRVGGCAGNVDGGGVDETSVLYCLSRLRYAQYS